MHLALSDNVLVDASGVAFMMILLASMANAPGGEIPLTFLAVAVIFMGSEQLLVDLDEIVRPAARAKR